MDVSQVEATKTHFLEWSGGNAPDTTFEIFTYVQLARLPDTDEEEVRLLLKVWMEQTWREPPEIANPKESFKFFYGYLKIDSPSPE